MAGKGSAPGERRGGRQKGTPNKVSLEIRDLARAYGPDAIAELARLAGLKGNGSENEQVRVSAIKELLDRGYGKATQVIAGDDNKPPVQVEVSGSGARLRALLDNIANK